MKTDSKFFLLNLCLIFVSCIFLSCGTDSKPMSVEKDNGCGERTVPSRGFKTDVAWIVFEWNCKPGGYGSGFLIDKERGAFYTNKHVSNEFDNYGKGSHKLYFNGKFYNVEIVKVPPLRDAAVVRITDEFDSSEFPEPAPFATEKVKKGDRVFVGGFHPHPYTLIEDNKSEGYDEIIVPLYEKYYHLGIRQLDKREEVVFEKMEGRIVSLNLTWEAIMKRKNKEIDSGSFTDSLADKTNLFNEILTLKDHKFPFGGLSGSPARNSRGEIIGIATRQDTDKFDYDKEELERKGSVEARRMWNTVFITPIESVADLRKYPDNK